MSCKPKSKHAYLKYNAEVFSLVITLALQDEYQIQTKEPKRQLLVNQHPEVVHHSDTAFNPHRSCYLLYLHSYVVLVPNIVRTEIP